MPDVRSILVALLTTFAFVASAGCGDQGETTLRDALSREGVDVAALFAEPTDAELARLLASWEADRPVPENVREEASRSLDGGDKLRVLSHDVRGVRHHGVVVEPPGDHAPNSLPVVMNLIGFGQEMRLEVPNDAAAYDGAYVTVLPSFRGHELRVGDDVWASGGDPYDQCDGGTDDALAFLEAALMTTPTADATRLAVIGGSRGGNVGMMVGVRREDVDGIANVAGPTNYLLEELLDVPNMVPLYANYFVAGLLEGSGNVEQARERMLSCSPLYFADRLPPLQSHHGTADRNVPFTQAEALDQRMRALGRAVPSYQLFVYQGANHELSDELQDIGVRVDGFVGSLF
ncbi:MAG: prolyl oligopeptidase family serine peptidase [Myxococcota bacterium]